MNILISGATGFLGHALADALLQRGHGVMALTRNVEKARKALDPRVEAISWHPPEAGPWTDALRRVDGVVNLSGEPVANHRWTEEQKAHILSSRVDTTRALVNAIAVSEPRPQVLVNQSAVGYYGSPGGTTLTEESPAGSDFLAQVVAQWEAAAKPVEGSGVRLVIVRTGIVLGKGGGALPPMVLPFRMFAGGTMGDPEQWVSWIHLEDEIEILIRALTDERMHGIYNATAPQPVTMQTLSHQIGEAIHRPSWVPMYGKFMRMALGPERGPSLLASQRVLPKRLEEAGYVFRYPESGKALRSILVG